MPDTARSTRQVIEVVYPVAAATINARSTRTVVEVVYPVAASTITARSSRVAMEVLYAEGVQTFTGSAAITTAAATAAASGSFTGVYTGSAAITTPAATAAASGHSLAPQSVTDNLVLSDSADGWILTQLVSNTISFTDQVDRAGPAGSLLQLQQQATVEVVALLEASDTLSLTDEAIQTSSQDYLVSQTILVTDLASAVHVLPTESASNTITFSDSANFSRPIADLLVLSQSAVGDIFFLEGGAANSLSLSDQATTDFIANQGPQDTVLFVQQATQNTIRTITVTQTLDVVQQGPLNSFTKEFLSLQAPFSFLTSTIILPNPLLQDGENLVDQLDIKWAEDGTLYTYVRRVTDRRLDYTFRLTREKSLELQDFIDAYSADEMRLCNFKGEIWRVKLVTNPVQYVHIARGSPKGPTVDVSLTFEGVKLNG
jgi:hypothetical protein